MFIAAYAFGAGAFYFFSLNDPGILGISTRRSARLIGTGLGIMAVLLFFLALFIAIYRRIKMIEERDARLRKVVGEAFEDVVDARDTASLVKANGRQLSLYDQLARGQARSSYRMSQIAMGMALLVLVSGAVGAIFVHGTVPKITTATLSGIGTALSGYISGTYLRVYERTLAQLNYYFQQPLLTSYVFTAERLTEKISRRKRDDEYSLMIRDVFGAVTSPALESGNGDSLPAARQKPAGASSKRPRFPRLRRG